MGGTDLTFNIGWVTRNTQALEKVAATLDKLAVKVDELGAKRANIGVDVDTAKAQAQLAALQEQSEKVAERSKDTGSAMGAAIAFGLSAAAPAVSAALVGGVALGFVGMGALVQKNNKDVQSSFVDLKNQVVGEMTDASDQIVPHLVGAEKLLQQSFANLGPDLHEAFSFAAPDIDILTKGVVGFADNAMPGMITSLENSQPIVRGISGLMGAFGTTVSTVLDGVSHSGDEFERDLNKLGDTVESLGSVAAGVLPGLASGFDASVGSVNTFLHAVTPVAPALGKITGQLLPVSAMSRIFGLASGPVDALGVKLQNTGNQMVGLNGNSSKLGSTVSGLGKTLVGAGKALPLLGAGVGFVSTVVADSDQKFVQWQDDILQGGAAASQALNQFQQQVSFMPGSFQKLLNGLTPLQRAQADFNIAVKAFGPNSDQAAVAQRNLATATAADEASQRRLNQAMLSTNEQLAQQQSLLLASVSQNLAFQGSLIGVKQAQDTYAKAVHDSGGKSLAAKQAYIGLQQAQEAEAESAVNAAAAAHSNASAADLAKIKSDAFAASVLGMAAASRGHMTPALKEMVAGLTAAQISAFEATGKIAGTRQEIVRLPDGKLIHINVLSNGQAASRETQNALDTLHDKQVTIRGVDLVSSTVNEIFRRNDGRVLHIEISPSGGAIQLPHRATGGPVVAGQPYIVGDGGRPEVFVPEQSGRILPSVSSAMLGGFGPIAVKPPRAFDSVSSTTTALLGPAPTRTAAQEDKLLAKLDDLLKAIKDYPPVTVYGSPGQSADQIANEVLRRFEFHGR